MKKGKIIIDIDPRMSGVALLEEGVLNEYYVEYGQNELLTGNVYKGKVVNVVGGLESVFIDIGREKNGFLRIGEDDRAEFKTGEFSGQFPAPGPLKEGDFVMVQVAKEESELKGAKLSANISLPGRLLVYLPKFDFKGISSKITDEASRDRLCEWIDKMHAPGEGFIARTASAACDKKEFLAEAGELRELYAEICRKYDETDGIGQIRSEGNLLMRTVRDILRANVDTIVCNDLATCGALRAEFARQGSRYEKAVRFFDDKNDILDAFGITREVDALLRTKAELKSGGAVIIERTEALTAIDVNTARCSAKDYAQTVFLTNAEAAAEIARQIRLRNIGGIIVVDFIDMQDEKQKAEIVEILRREVSRDRIKTRVLNMTELGLVEITRKKVGNELSSFLLDSCPLCKEPASSQSKPWIARKLKAALKKLFAERDVSSALVSVNPAVMDYIFETRFFSADCESVWRGKRIYLIPNPDAKFYAFAVSGSNASHLNLPNNAKLLY